jgi:hypothetical protein
MKIYCQGCGAKIEFSVRDKPRFCHGCGASLSLGSDRSVKANTSPVDDDSDYDAKRVPSISQLDIDVEVNRVGSESIENVMGTASGASTALDPIDILDNVSPEEFREQFQKEAGTLRSNGSPESE